MSFGLLGACAGLAWFLIVSAVASAAVAVAVRWTIARPAGRLAQAGARAWLALRLLPSLAGLLFVVTVFSRAFGRLEPREAAETPGACLLIMAAVSAVLVGRAIVAALAGWHRVTLQARGWLARSDQLRCTETSIPVHAVRGLQPTVSLAGLFRPHLFVSSDVAAALTPIELDAVVAHERQHRSTRDNLKRLALLAMPDVLRFVGTGAAIEARWLSAVEMEADERAVGRDPARGLALASALVKVARLMPVVAPPAPVCDFYNGGLLAARVGRLIDPRPAAPRSSALPWLGLAVVSLIAWVVTSSAAQSAVHQATEFIVNFPR